MKFPCHFSIGIRRCGQLDKIHSEYKGDDIQSD